MHTVILNPQDSSWSREEHWNYIKKVKKIAERETHNLKVFC